MNTAPLEVTPDYIGIFILLMVLILVPTFLVIVAKVARGFSFGSFLALMAAVIAGGVLLVLLAILLPYVFLSRSSELVSAEAMSSESFHGNAPMATKVISPELVQNSSSDAPVVARKPHDPPQAEIPVPATAKTKEPLKPLPDWVVSGLDHTHQNKKNLLESSRLVVESGLFVTVGEAQYDALAKAGLKLKANLQLRYPHYPLANLEVSPDEVRQVALRRSYYQLVEHNFGDVLKNGEPLKQNMYRGYLEIEDSPRVRETLFAKWKRKVGNERTAWLGGGLGLITLLCASIAVYLRASHSPATMKSH
ncbi:hypothetical protein [Gimesia fumaroli]|uniref:Uncharacterized protein n=1 Tax=Gimesia fumaroli TaxID=2527976 RepID=A0A518IL34_9PLAN|nr:hypothetical protein [Gimesia fumaroli]QDV53801.1 hypothetical protein Enr17x_58840 [Gimesia fumaroli]